MTADYLITCLVIILLPGTGVIYTLACGLSQGWRMSVLAALGCTLGIVPAMVASIMGLAALLHASALAFRAIKYLGVAYLFYMAWGAWREGSALDVPAGGKEISPGRVILNGLALNILNPKLSIFFLAFLPQFVPTQSASPSLEMLRLALIFMLLTFVVFVIYGAFASAARHYVVSRPEVMTWLRRGFATAFGLLGVKLALTPG